MDFSTWADTDPPPAPTTAGSLLVNVSGAVKAKITVLITPDEVDQAIKKLWIGDHPANEISIFH